MCGTARRALVDLRSSVASPRLWPASRVAAAGALRLRQQGSIRARRLRGCGCSCHLMRMPGAAPESGGQHEDLPAPDPPPTSFLRKRQTHFTGLPIGDYHDQPTTQRKLGSYTADAGENAAFRAHHVERELQELYRARDQLGIQDLATRGRRAGNRRWKISCPRRRGVRSIAAVYAPAGGDRCVPFRRPPWPQLRQARPSCPSRTAHRAVSDRRES